jgi:SAM-dependent methyltransferase
MEITQIKKKNKRLNLLFTIKNWHYSTWLIHHLTLKQFERIFKMYVNKKGIVFDVGCSIKPYTKLIEQYSTKYYGLEHISTQHYEHKADILGTAYYTGLKDCSIDTVFTASVLEHLEEPTSALSEMHRILKPGGIVILSSPLFWHIHLEPRDFYRYTQFGYDYLLKKSGFEVLEIVPLSGFWITVCEMLIFYISRFNRGIVKFIPIIPCIILLLQGCAVVLNKIDSKSTRWTWAYVAVGRKVR